MILITIYAVAGVLLLVFLIRRFVRHRPTFEEYREERDRHAEAAMAAIRHANAALDAEEALRPVMAGLREFLELHPDHFPCRLERKDDVLAVHIGSAPPRRLEVAWIVRTAHLSPQRHGRDVQGGGHWEVREGGARRSFTELAGLMRVLTPQLAPASASEIPPLFENVPPHGRGM